DRVAEPHVSVAAAQLTEPYLPSEPLSRAQGVRRQRPGHAVAVAFLSVEVGPHVPVAGGDAPVGVDQEQADPVVELAVDRPALVGDEPARAVRRRERVVRAGEYDLVDAQAAKLPRAVAGAG